MKILFIIFGIISFIHMGHLPKFQKFERKTTKKKRNQSLFTVTLIFLIAVMITPVWIGKICLLMVMSIHHFIMLKKVEIINE